MLAMSNVCGHGAMSVICQAAWDIVTNPLGVKEDVGGAVRSVTGDVLSGISQDMASAATELLKTLSTFWMSVDTPDLTSAGSPVAAIEADTSWIVAAIAVVCILVAAGRMAIRRRGEPAGTMAIGLVRLVVVSAVATFLVETAGKLGDTFSADLMSSAHLGGHGWSGIISATAMSSAIGPGAGMLLIVSLLIIFSSLIQLLLMILRLGLLIVLTGTLPLAAAASMSDWGETWWRKHVGWLTAWLLYKPAAALLYAAAFVLTQGKSLVEVLSGFMLLILSVLILPALLKVIVPMTASLGAASGGALAMGAAGALATGAIKIAGGAGTGGAAGAASAAGQAGTSGTTAAPSGNAAVAGDSKGFAPTGAGPSTQTDRSSHRQSSTAEQAVVRPPGSQSPSHDGIGKTASSATPGRDTPDTAGASGASGTSAASGGRGAPADSDGSGPSEPGGPRPGNDGAGQGPYQRPSGSQTPERPDMTGPDGPSGAADNGDDQDREIGG
jgi:hypothetical protein